MNPENNDKLDALIGELIDDGESSVDIGYALIDAARHLWEESDYQAEADIIAQAIKDATDLH